MKFTHSRFWRNYFVQYFLSPWIVIIKVVRKMNKFVEIYFNKNININFVQYIFMLSIIVKTKECIIYHVENNITIILLFCPSIINSILNRIICKNL